MIRRIAYASVPRADLAAHEVPQIVRKSRANNEREGIGGVLVFTGSDFVQLIEGPPAQVETLWHKIRADVRHHSVALLVDMPDDVAWFPEWRVGYLYDENFLRRIATWRSRTGPLNEEDRLELRLLFAATDSY
jgi:hypothetical protein